MTKVGHKLVRAMTSLDYTVFSLLIEKDVVSKKYLLDILGLSERRLGSYLLSKLVTESDKNIEITEKGFKFFYENSLKKFARNKEATTKLKKIVNIYLIGDVNKSNNTGYVVGFLEYKNNIRYFQVTVDNCQSMDEIILKGFYSGVSMLNQPCRINAYLPIVTGISNILTNSIKEIVGNVSEYKLKSLCQILVEKNEHDVYFYEGKEFYSKEVRNLENSLYSEICNHEGWLSTDLDTTLELFETEIESAV